MTLLDFGRANAFSEPGRSDVGAFGYYPPELHFAKPKRDDLRTDTFGFGISCFTLLSGESALVLDRMTDPTKLSGLDFMWHSQETYIDEYYGALRQRAGLNVNEIMLRSNFPPELKRTPLAKYVASLFHPNIEQRPFHLGQVARSLRIYGGELQEHNVSLN